MLVLPLVDSAAEGTSMVHLGLPFSFVLTALCTWLNFYLLFIFVLNVFSCQSHVNKNLQWISCRV